MGLSLYNTLGRDITEFVPLVNSKISIYACGPTVYNYAHIGNLRTYIHEDILKRTLIFNGYRVKHVMNITDVGHLVSDEDHGEDKMELGATKEGLSIYDLAEKYTSAFKNDIEKLNILSPTIWCKATEHIQEQIDLVSKLEDLGYIYRLEDGLYYDTSKFKEYGLLGGQKLEDLKAGARVQLSEGKKNPTDFALWKFSPKDKKRLMEWESPWGKGFPGWHIECSAMALKYLGEQMDIHCGGVDHIKVHHTNELAQVGPIIKKRWVNFWFHPEFLIMREGKMAKSSGKFITIENLQEKGFSPLAYRFYVLNSHYRSKLTFSMDIMSQAQQGYNNLVNKIKEIQKDEMGGSFSEEKLEEIKTNIKKIVNRDLNTPELMAYLWKVVKNKHLPSVLKIKSFESFDQVLGLDLKNIQEDEEIPSEILELVDKRTLAKNKKEYRDADQIRNIISSKGYIIEDSKEGIKIRKK